MSAETKTLHVNLRALNPFASLLKRVYLTMILFMALCGLSARGATTITGLESSTPLLSSAFGVRPPGSTSSPAVSNDNSAKTYGYSFTATASQLLVTHLGMFDSQYTVPSTGFYQDHRVGLWTVGGVLLAQVTLSAGNSNTLEGMFRYSALDTPLILVAGTTYVLGAYYPQVTGFQIDRLVNNIYMPSAADGFTLGTTQFRFGQNMPFPDSVAINKPYVGPTLRYQVVPEPSCLLVTFSAASGLILRRSRKAATTEFRTDETSISSSANQKSKTRPGEASRRRINNRHSAISSPPTSPSPPTAAPSLLSLSDCQYFSFSAFTSMSAASSNSPPTAPSSADLKPNVCYLGLPPTQTPAHVCYLGPRRTDPGAETPAHDLLPRDETSGRGRTQPLGQSLNSQIFPIRIYRLARQPVEV